MLINDNEVAAIGAAYGIIIIIWCAMVSRTMRPHRAATDDTIFANLLSVTE